MKHVVVIGGGHGQSAMIKGLKKIEGISLSAIVTVADSGGSTGRLRELYQIPAVGDIRNVLVSMAEDGNDFEQILDYRFKGDDEVDVEGHALGNLVLAALIDLKGSLPAAIKEASDFLKVKGKVLPSSLEDLSLYARYEDGSIEKGEAVIPNKEKRIREVFYDHEVKADEEALQAIREADLILYGFGSLYTSLLPNLIIKEIKEAVNASKARKILFLNAMTQPGETADYDLNDHLKALWDCGVKVDLIVHHSDRIPASVLKRYEEEGSIEVRTDGFCAVPLWRRNLLDFSKNNVRHDPNKIRAVVEELLED